MLNYLKLDKMGKNLQILLICLFSGVLIQSCTKDDPVVKEQAAIDKYLADHSITTAPKASGLYYIETYKGTGAKADAGDQVKVKYKGTFTDGTTFDSGIYTFVLGSGRVIKGWDEGIAYMNEGGKAILLIPSDLAYGPYGSGSIPGYTPLVFEVELIDVF
jgi:FKBP-type peptidyl-prolyl cis-trans isomerase